MKKIALIIILVLGFATFANLASAQYKPQADYFWGIGCPHCAIVSEYLDDHPEINEKINLQKHEIYQDRENADLFNKMSEEYEVPMMARGVPTMFAGANFYTGSSEIIDYFKQYEGTVVSDPEPVEVDPDLKDPSKLTFPVLIFAAAADSVNPCTFAVLILLMAAIINADGKKRALWTGIAFTLSIFISYYLMGLGLYSAIASAGTSILFMRIVGIIAILLGLFNLKDFFWYGKGFKMEVPTSWRPLMKKVIKSITNPLGGFFIGFLVSLFLLPCTSGPYIIVLGMLGHTETLSEARWLLALYNLIFILPMLAISFAVYFGMDVKKAESERRKNLRYMHLVIGLVMLALGFWIMFY